MEYKIETVTKIVLAKSYKFPLNCCKAGYKLRIEGFLFRVRATIHNKLINE